MKRQRTRLARPPEDPRELGDFPRSPLGPEAKLWRATKSGKGPWWFSSSLDGRFDLPRPEGTCYLAMDEISALLEVIGPERSGARITTEFLAQRRLFELRLPERRALADLTARRAAGFGVTLEIHSRPRYDLPQAWARALRQSGARGLRYFARHDPAAGYSVALFGESGEREGWDRGSEHRADAPRLVARLWKECGVQVADRPRLDQLQLTD